MSTVAMASEGVVSVSLDISQVLVPTTRPLASDIFKSEKDSNTNIIVAIVVLVGVSSLVLAFVVRLSLFLLDARLLTSPHFFRALLFMAGAKTML